MTAYTLTLFIHSYLRWLIVALGFVVFVRSLRGWQRASVWSEIDERLHKLFVAFIDTQFTLGLLLYVFLSPLTAAFFAQPGPGMKQAVLRFFGVEHIFAMLLVIAIVHVGRVRSKKSPTAALRQRRVFLSVAFALLLVMLSIPWPFLPYGRPLLRPLSHTITPHPTLCLHDMLVRDAANSPPGQII